MNGRSGGTLAEAFAASGRVSDYDVPRRIVEPLVRSLKDLAASGMTHRAIRPDNLFYRDEGRHTPLFGDCVTAPPGFDQPLAFEPIERALAGPAGRGNGDIADDIYALAVSLVVLLVGRNPVAHMSDDELLAAKVERGSYTALAERERVPMAMIEPLRGMLNDDPAERWGIDEIELWLSGRRVAPARKRAIKHAAMPLHFAGYDHVTRTTLARAMTQNVREAAAVARQGHLEPWLIRHMNAPDLADAVNEVVEGTRAHEGDLRGTDDVMIARLAIVLDPPGPIRYRGFSFVIEGFGPALAVAWLRDGHSETPSEAISLGLPGLWFAAQTTSKPGFGPLDRMFAQLRACLQAPGPGYGLERCLYETNPALPCQSPQLSNQYVTEVRELMPALDEAAGHASAGTRPMDRHIAAFIAARFSHDIEPHLTAIGDSREDKSLIGIPQPAGAAAVAAQSAAPVRPVQRHRRHARAGDQYLPQSGNAPGDRTRDSPSGAPGQPARALRPDRKRRTAPSGPGWLCRGHGRVRRGGGGDPGDRGQRRRAVRGLGPHGTAVRGDGGDGDCHLHRLGVVPVGAVLTPARPWENHPPRKQPPPRRRRPMEARGSGNPSGCCWSWCCSPSCRCRR